MNNSIIMIAAVLAISLLPTQAQNPERKRPAPAPAARITGIESSETHVESEPIEQLVVSEELASTRIAQIVTPSEPRDSIKVEEAVLKIIESVNVPAERSGIIREIDASEGDLVEQGRIIARIDDRQPRLKLEQANVELDIARHEAEDDINIRFTQKALAVAAAELRRAMELRDADFDLITDTEIDRLELIRDKSQLDIERSEMDLETLRLKVKLKEAELAVQEDDVDRYQIRCPIDGMVVKVEKREGEWINESDTVVRVVRIDRLRVEGLVTAAQAAEGLTGRSMTLQVDVPGLESMEFEGKVVFVDPEANPFNMKVRIWAEVENRDLKLFPGWKANVHIQ